MLFFHILINQICLVSYANGWVLFILSVFIASIITLFNAILVFEIISSFL